MKQNISVKVDFLFGVHPLYSFGRGNKPFLFIVRNWEVFADCHWRENLVMNVEGDKRGWETRKIWAQTGCSWTEAMVAAQSRPKFHHRKPEVTVWGSEKKLGIDAGDSLWLPGGSRLSAGLKIWLARKRKNYFWLFEFCFRLLFFQMMWGNLKKRKNRDWGTVQWLSPCLACLKSSLCSQAKLVKANNQNF